MIDLTVKTLDSRNHTFSLTDDITVRGFKEYIAETVSVPADSQRLIYCGRVLQDEKHLSEYDVNGKVIHLVQRAPPQTRAQMGSSGGQSRGQNRSRGDQQQGQRMRYRQTRTQFHGNPMYLGSFSIPAEVVDGHEWAIPQLSNTLSNSRLVVARRMLDQANRVLDRLENPSAAAANEATAAEREEAATATGGSTETETQQQEQTANRTARLLQQLTGSGPMGGIFEFATALAQSGPPAFWPMRDGEGSGAEPSAPTSEATGDEGQPQPQEQQQQTPRRGAANSGTDQPGNARPTPPAGPQAPRPPQMAQLLGRMMDTEDRLRPFLVRYRELMELDPEIPGGHTASGEDIGTVEENQRIADGVTECFHFLSHANHALSDIIVDVSQQPPRNLRCRPMVIQHSAILQAGIPIQVEAHISVARNDGSNGESGEDSGDATSRPPTSSTATPPTAPNPIDLTFVTDQSDLPPPTAGQQSEQQQSQQQAQNQPQVDSPFGAIFNITNNMEVLMEMGPPENVGTLGGNGGNTTGTEQSQNASVNNNNNNNNNNTAGASGVTAGIFPWGPTPSPEVFRNLLHLVVHHMAQSAATVTTVASTTSTATPTTATATPTTCVRQRVQVGVGSGAAPNPGQSTQARSNVGTHPTTSTQTRSTARPHVFHPHAHPLGVGMGMGQNMDFDPFLPCNSHHIHRTPSATPTNTAATSSPQQTAQPSQSTTPNGAAQTQPDAPSAPVERVSTQPLGEARSSSLSLREEIAKLRGTSSGRSDATNNAESERAPTLADLLSARGINNVLWNRESFDGSHLLQRLFTACSRIEVSEWLAYLNSGNFTRDDVWRRLRPHVTCAFLYLVSPTTMVVGAGRWRDEALSARICEQAIAELRQYYSDAFDAEERQTNVRNGRRIDLPATIEAIVQPYVQEATVYMEEYSTTAFDDEWGAGLIAILRDCAHELVNVLLFSLRREQAGLESVIRHIATKAMAGQHSEFRDWVLGSVVDWFCDYCRRVERIPNSNIIRLLVYKDAEEVSASSDNTEVPKTPDAQAQAEPEPMETEEASGNRTINDPLDLADGEEVPTTFRGHEQLLPEWVPIIARDGIRQRRQLQLQGGVTAFSDAYLDGLPSKRRKLVEQQKPRLLVSPTPNHPLIPASVERLVRENVLRAGVEEAEGAAAAVAADPGVRRAFGQAIRDCLDPRRLQTPDFPDARRFPNATKYFGDKDASSKQ